MRLHTFFRLVLSFSLLVPAFASATDLTLHQRVTTSGPRNESHDAVQYWTPNRMVTDDPNSRTIVDLDAETMTIANKREHTYFTQTFAGMRQQSETMNAELKKHMESLPPEARQMMEKQMGMGKTAETTAVVTPTGKTEKIAGYEAKEYTISAGPISGSIWASDALQPPGGTKAADAYAKMFGSGGGPGAKFAQALTQIKGVPLRTVMGGQAAQALKHTTEVVEVSQKSPPPDVLNVPEGFKKIDPPHFEVPPPQRAKPQPH